MTDKELHLPDLVGDHGKIIIERWGLIGYTFSVAVEGVEYVVTTKFGEDEIGQSYGLFASHALNKAENECILHHGKLWYQD